MPPKRRHCHGDPGVHQDTAASLSPLPEARLSHGALPAGGHRVPPGPPWPASPGPTPEPTVGAAAARGSAEPAKERSRRPRHEAARGRRSRRHTGTRPHLRGQEHRRRRGPQKPAPSPLSRARPRRGPRLAGAAAREHVPPSLSSLPPGRRELTEQNRVCGVPVTPAERRTERSWALRPHHASARAAHARGRKNQ